MSRETIEFSKEEIDIYLSKLSKEYKKLGGRNMPVEIVLTGGAAVVTNYGFRDSTTDIDAIIPVVSIMKEAITHVGDNNGLHNGWLNADFTKTSSYSPNLASFSKHYKTYNQILNVRTITGEYLVAMKLKSARQYKYDMSDIVGILAEHERQGKPILYKDIDNAVINLYGNWNGISLEAKDELDTIFSIGHYAELYDKVRTGEINTHALLKEFQEKYPDVLASNSINNVIRNITEKNTGKESVRETLKRLKEERAQRKAEKGNDTIEEIER